MSAAYSIAAFAGSDPALAPYKNHICLTYKKALRYGNPWFRDIDQDVFFKVYQQVFDAYLARPEAVIRLALLRDDPDICLGWSLSEPKILHFVFVKPKIQARCQGIGTDLIEHFKEPPEIITHLTTIGRVIWQKKFPTTRFNPFA